MNIAKLTKRKLKYCCPKIKNKKSSHQKGNKLCKEITYLNNIRYKWYKNHLLKLKRRKIYGPKNWHVKNHLFKFKRRKID